ncbi:MAG: polymer-forming cytoskeletal protein [Acidobacteria bacterium]|nr:polymer-forming cytoskeletal protein [Acidobacteriota bacterium]
MSDPGTFRHRLAPDFFAILLVLIAFPALLEAIDMRAGRRITVPAGEVISTNLYVAASEVYVSGSVEGDLTAAGGEVSLDGTVANDVTVGGGQLRINGQIGGDLRVAGGQVLLTGRVNGDLVVAGGVVRVLSGAMVGGDVLLAGGDVLLEGTLVRSVRAVAGKVLLNGTITGPVSLRTNSLAIGEGANLENELVYFAPVEATVAENARIKGPITFHMISGMDQDWLRLLLQRAGSVFFLLRLTMTLGAGLIGFLLLRKPTQDLIQYALGNFGKEFLRGFVLFFVIPPAIFLIAITVVGVPVAFLGGLFHLSVGIVSVIYAGIALGALLLKWLRHRPAFEVTWQAVLLGISLAFLVRLVPYVGFLLNATFFLVIFGALYQRFWILLRGAAR